jgi:hypothetical protein
VKNREIPGGGVSFSVENSRVTKHLYIAAKKNYRQSTSKLLYYKLKNYVSCKTEEGEIYDRTFE